MNDNQRLQLQNMIKANNVEDQTTLIRELKHSEIFHKEVNMMISIKDMYKGNDEKIYEECVSSCNFLFTYYTDIFNKIRKDELDINILNKFLDVLKQIEDGLLDQHNGSFLIGTILKELYIDSALKKSEKLDEIAEKSIQPKTADKNISWKQYKLLTQ